MSPKRLYRIFAIAEMITWTLLILGMIGKYAFGLDWAVTVGGSIHGFVFLSYAVIAVFIGVNQRWNFGRIAFAVLTAIVPYATVPFDHWLVRKGHLEGDWRREAGDHPSDENFINRMLRLVLAHPVTAIAIGVVGVAVVFTVLLMLGPPVPAPSE